ncbi:MAG: IS1634 family transposase [Wolinella sp.]
MSEVSTKSIDHLGLVAGMIEELEIKQTIEACLPSKSEEKKVSHATAIAAMILNGLGYANKQLYLTPRFFEKKATEHLLGSEVKAEYLNKDTLARTLDAIYNHGVSELYEKISHQAVRLLGLTPTTVHLDSTSFHVDGAYKQSQLTNEEPQEDKDNEPKTPTPIKLVKGYSRDHHPSLNQVVLNLIVEHQAGIPLMMRAADGNQIDARAFASLVDAHIDSLKAMHTSTMTLIADAALFTAKGLEAIKEKQINFISRVPNKLKEAKALMQDKHASALTPLDENYSFKEHTIDYGGMEQKWVLYKSTYSAKREDATLAKKLLGESTHSTKKAKKLMIQPFFCEADAKEALGAFKSKHPTIVLKNETLHVKPKYNTKGRPKPNQEPSHYEYYWQFDITMHKETFVTQSEEESGYFILATNNLTLTPEELLQEYKSQQRVERGFRFLKSPEFLSDALFLKKAQRIEAMLMIMTLCLVVYAALEYRIRKELKEQNKTFPNQLGKPVQNPTARWVFECFFEIQIVRIEQLKQQVIANLLERNHFILDLLGARYWRYYRIGDKMGKWGAK